jgi:hypothetical protein
MRPLSAARVAMAAFEFAGVVHRQDVRVVERRRYACFLVEPRETF